MTPATQVKLLRVLQERRFRRLGGRVEQSVDVRMIAATNIDPVEAVKVGKLREDLYYRLNVFAFRLPPLRERKEDLALLTQAFINEFNQRNQKSIAGVDQQTMRMIEHYGWPGNVRELRNVIERLLLLTDDAVDEAVVRQLLSGRHGTGSGSGTGAGPLADRVAAFEREAVLGELAAHGHRVAETARALGLERSHLYKKCQQLGIDLKSERAES